MSFLLIVILLVLIARTDTSHAEPVNLAPSLFVCRGELRQGTLLGCLIKNSLSKTPDFFNVCLSVPRFLRVPRKGRVRP